MEDQDLLELIPEHQNDPDFVKCILDFYDAMVQLKVLSAMEWQGKLKKKKHRNAGTGPNLGILRDAVPDELLLREGR